MKKIFIFAFAFLLGIGSALKTQAQEIYATLSDD